MSSEISKLINLHEVAALSLVHVRDGVILRPMLGSDAASLLACLDADPSIRERVTVAAAMRGPEDVQAQVVRYKQDNGLIRYVIVEYGKVVGLMSFWRDSGYFGQKPNPHAYGFGYFLAPDARGRGLVTDSLRALMDAAQANLHVEAFMAFCEDNNSASSSLLVKSGLLPTEISYTEPKHGWAERCYLRRMTE